MAALVLGTVTMVLLGISVWAMVTQESDPTFAGEGDYEPSWTDTLQDSTLEIPRRAV